MWHLAIPIPNWTGILTGFCPGVIVGIAAMFGVAWWGNRQSEKRKFVPDDKFLDLKEFIDLVEIEDQTD